MYVNINEESHNSYSEGKLNLDLSFSISVTWSKFPDL